MSQVRAHTHTHTHTRARARAHTTRYLTNLIYALPAEPATPAGNKSICPLSHKLITFSVAGEWGRRRRERETATVIE